MLLITNPDFLILLLKHSSRISQVNAAVRGRQSSMDLVKLLSVQFSASSNDADCELHLPNPDP